MPACREHAAREPLTHLPQQREIRPAAGAVAVDRGADDGRDARVACSGRALRAVVSSDDSSQPAVRTIPSATSIATASRSPIASTNAPQRRLAERGGADDDSRDPGGHERLRIGGRADAAAELYRHRRRRRDGRRGELDGSAAVPGGRERDDVDEGRARWPPHAGRARAGRRRRPRSASKSPRRSRTAFPSRTSTAGRIAKSRVNVLLW